MDAYCANADYRETLKSVGLSDPFDSDCVESIAMALHEELDIENAYNTIAGA